jgi:hypothetical protein
VCKFLFLTVSFIEGSWSSLIYCQHSDWATEWTVRGSGPDKGKTFSLLRNVQSGSGGPYSLPHDGYGGYFPGIKRAKREVNHSSPSRSEIKWRYYLYSPLSVFMA